MLGSRQKDALKKWLLQSRGVLKFIVSSVMWNDFAANAIAWGNAKLNRNIVYYLPVDFTQPN